ncbi:MAG: hypothetical protein KKA73_02660 [Chloroflexi bacterium]|nr:hypothetical protein [Chloroflexota bacterium]MBU1746570.1 hypothetical protein [Chloroflexota bacterium]MBU1877586.1 hypothetical protein [Chloroflexota bacterium]
MNTEVQEYVNLIALRVQEANTALNEGRPDDAAESLAQALGVALQLHPQLGLEATTQTVSAGKRLVAAGDYAAADRLARALHAVIDEIAARGWRTEELQMTGELAREALSVIGLVGLDAGQRELNWQTARERAAEVDEVSGGWGLYEWVNGQIDK